MDRASDRDRSSRKSERDPDPKHRDRDRDRDREHKHRRRHDEEKPLRDDDRRRHDDDDDDKPRDADRHRRAKDRRRSPAASPPRRERRDSVSVDPPRDADRPRRPHADSADASSPRRERSSDRQLRGSVDRPADDSPPKHHKHRRHYRDDSPLESEARAKKSSEKHRDSVERGKESSRKRKEYDGDEEDRDERGKRVRDERRERRRFAEDESNGESVDVEKRSRRGKDDYEEEKKSRRERRKFNDGMNSEKRNGDVNNSASEKSGSSAKVPEEPLTSKVSMSSAASNLPIPTKVSSITTTNENGVKITRSDEVPGKSSTDGTTASVAGKSGSLDALAKAKKTLQLQKELNEKLKKLPMLNKLPTMKTDTNLQAAVNKVGVKTPTSFVASTTSAMVGSGQPALGAATSESISATAGMSVTPGATTTTNFEAVKRAQELAAKMGFRQDPEFAPLINMFPGPANVDASVLEKPSKAPVLRLDAQGREVDEHGHVINIPKLTNLSTLKVNINKQKKDSFQILKPELDGDPRSNPHFDASLGIDKTKLLRRPKRNFEFVEEGRWSKQAEIIKFKNQFGDAQAKELKMKQSQLAKAKGEIDNPNLIELPERFERAPKEKKKDDIPEMEWWDKPLLPSGSYIDIGGESMKIDKMTIYVEHPRPIEPPAEPAPPPPQPLKLTKKEQKKLRTQRRLAKEKDRQEMIRQGLIEPPKPKVKMSNLMKVLGSEATQDPTRLEMEIRSAAAEREQAHVDRNIARKLTPAERREKKERKLFEDPNTLETFVSVYKIKDLTDPKTRFKVDVNAQENRLSGVAVISDGITVVVVEGGKKSINRYGKLMLNRIDWAAAVGNGEEGIENKELPVNSCGLVWQGSVARPSFHRFNIHQCRTEAAAKKVFADAGVPHYWDLAFNFNEEVLLS